MQAKENDFKSTGLELSKSRIVKMISSEIRSKGFVGSISMNFCLFMLETKEIVAGNLCLNSNKNAYKTIMERRENARSLRALMKKCSNLRRLVSESEW